MSTWDHEHDCEVCFAVIKCSNEQCLITSQKSRQIWLCKEHQEQAKARRKKGILKVLR